MLHSRTLSRFAKINNRKSLLKEESYNQFRCTIIIFRRYRSITMLSSSFLQYSSFSVFTTSSRITNRNPPAVRFCFVVLLSTLYFISCLDEIEAFQSFTFPKFNLENLIGTSTTGSNNIIGNNAQRKRALELENELLVAIEEEKTLASNQYNNNESTRLVSNSERIQEIIDALESLDNSASNIPNPSISPEIYGRWRLLYSTNKDTSSPIQRSAINNAKFPIYQDIVVNTEKNQLQVNQVIQFTNDIYLSVDAIASTEAYPIPELTERKTTGKVFGLNLLGVSYVGDEAILATKTNQRPNTRIDFVFDEGNFYIGDSFKIPYPVPFRLPILRDWVKGWLSISYLSPTGKVRISRGNKGTTFVLMKEE